MSVSTHYAQLPAEDGEKKCNGVIPATTFRERDNSASEPTKRSDSLRQLHGESRLLLERLDLNHTIISRSKTEKFLSTEPQDGDFHSAPSPADIAQTNSSEERVWSASSALALYLLGGILIFWFLGNDMRASSPTNRIVDALYFCVVTMTTVGYGDVVPTMVVTKLVNCVFVFAGFAIVDLLLTATAHFIVRKQEDLVKDVIYQRAAPRMAHAERMVMKRLQKTVPLLRLTGKLHFKAESPAKEVEEAWERVYIAAFFLLGVILVGTLVLHFLEKMPLVDAFYCACVTVTTVGYGDKSFETLPGRIFAVVWILSSTLITAHFFVCLTEARVAVRQHHVANLVVHRQTTLADLDAADLDMKGKVTRAEFILYKLKELGKVNYAELEEICEEFDSLDVDRDGDIDRDDLRLAQAEKGMRPPL